MIDGATRASPDENEIVAAWVRSLSDALSESVAGHPSRQLTEHLATAIERARLEGHEWHPSATVAIAQLEAQGISALVLGDAAVLIPHGNGEFSSIQDQRLQEVARNVRRARREAREAGDHHRFRELTEQLIAQEDHWRNRDGGFWVASCDPTVVDNAVTASFPGVNVVMAMSDGVFNEVARATDEGRAPWQEFSLDVRAALERLRKDVLERDHKVDDFATVVAQWTS